MLTVNVLGPCESITQENRAEAHKHVEVTIKPTAGKRPLTSLSRTPMRKLSSRKWGNSHMGSLTRSSSRQQSQEAPEVPRHESHALMGFPSGLSTHSSSWTSLVAAMSITIQQVGITVITQLLHCVSFRLQQPLQSWQPDKASGAGIGSMARNTSLSQRVFTAQDKLIDHKRGVHCCVGHNPTEA